jgi:hypothetical protein
MAFFRPFPYTKYEFAENGVKTDVVDIFRYVKLQDKLIDDMNAYRFYQIHDGERPDILSYKLYGTPDYYWTFFIINESLHEGMSGWPLSSEEFNNYMKSEYDGVIINARPQIIYDSDGLITDHRNSIADRFKIGETMKGLISGATGTLVGKNTRYNYLIIKDVVGEFRKTEIVRGQTTLDFVTSYEVFRRELGPKYYTDTNGLITDHDLFIEGGTPLYEINMVSNREWEEAENDRKASIRIVRPEFIQEFVLNFKRLISK